MRRLAAAMLAVWLLGPGPGRAQTLEVAPVSVTFGPDQRTASLTVTNRSAAPMTIQVRPFRWQEETGTSALTETSALAVSPPLAEVPPGQSQSVRMLLRQPAGATEATYRLLVDQLPPATRTSAVTIVLRLSLPVFAPPPGGGEAVLDWEVETGRGGAFLRVRNRGTKHAVITEVQLGAGRGGSVKTAAHPYVLAGADVRWPIEGGRGWSGGTMPLTVKSDAGQSVATARVVSAAP